MRYTAEDEQLIQEKWSELQHSCEGIYKSEEHRNLVDRAFFLAKEAHQGVRRRSGEPYFLHPIAVAKIVVDEIGLGAKSVAAALLHDVVEDTDYTVEDIERLFGHKIASMVDGLTKMSGFNTTASEQAENFRKMLLTLSDDVRVILIKIADRLHNMRTLGSMPQNKQIKITSETIYLFAPLAHRLGLFSIKSELEDLCMMYRFPKQYEQITNKLSETETNRAEFIGRFTSPITKALDNNGIDYEISGRVKSVYSIWNKMQRKQIPFEEIYDLFAVRIVFKPLEFPSEKTQCWQIYSSITDLYTPKPERLRDWISMPKANGYEALHSTVMGPDGVWVEVQIRTQRMNDIAERGFAAHWKYKKATISQNEDEFDKWLKQIRSALNSPTENAVDFLDNFKLSLYTSEIVVFTPKGESRTMPNGSTALDFAYDVHSKIGNSAISAKINHKLQPVTTVIKSGDQIEIITADNAKPKREWLDLVTTGKAKHFIKGYFKRENQKFIERGSELLELYIKEHNIKFEGDKINKLIHEYKCTNKEDLFSKIGTGAIKLDNLEKVLKNRSNSSKILKFWTLFIPSKDNNSGGSGAGRSDDKSPEFEIAPCCKPIPGDNVVGFRDPESEMIIVHKSTCEELNRLASQFGQNIIKEQIHWSQYNAISHLSTINFQGHDRTGMILDLIQLISGHHSINIHDFNIRSLDGIFEGSVGLYIKDTESLSKLITEMSKIEGIESVKRSTK